MLSVISSYAVAESHNLGVYIEASGSETAQNINYTYIPDPEDYEYLYWGLGFSGVQSDEALESNNRTKVFPVNLILGLRANYTISPYIEFGVDLGDLVVDAISGDSTEIDVTGSLGITYKVKNLNIYAYYKRYSVKFSESNSASKSVSTNNFGLPGLGISFEF